jgi:hypothetical protein
MNEINWWKQSVTKTMLTNAYYENLESTLMTITKFICIIRGVRLGKLCQVMSVMVL